ncbi:subtilisin-like protein [Myriangium duriaei CBS 260.36]|uniref:Subtilisin-like protein n=1 Tax=Myriangium duriaei CBS 260.36 TaxID=1168546 RepID=A0A9P4J8N6_9PEZI|nr:subtilisin-like protein [Myriangium duriaei CBS 260.36]
MVYCLPGIVASQSPNLLTGVARSKGSDSAIPSARSQGSASSASQPFLHVRRQVGLSDLVGSIPDPAVIDVSNRYIITLKASVDMPMHIHFVKEIHTGIDGSNVFEGISHRYDFAGFRGYAGQFDRQVIESLKKNKDVAAIEADQIFTSSDVVVQQKSSSALGSISHRELKDLYSYVYDSSAGMETFGYVVDSGIKLNHVEFENRAHNGYNAIKLKDFVDSSGHGTHVAGLMGSRTYGVAKNCSLIAVKVSDRGISSEAFLLDGYQWAVKDILKKRRKARSVINISLAGPYSKAVNKAVDAAFSKGVSTVVSAGNQHANATKRSPASAHGAITVGSTDSRRSKNGFSNFGPSVDIFAPGYKIRSPWTRSKTATYILSGTSMSSAHVSGLVLYLKGLKNLPNAKKTKSYLLELALRDVVKNPAGSPNLFAYNGSGR